VDHAQTHKLLLVQMYSHSGEEMKKSEIKRIIAPTITQTHEIIFPIPGWDEREVKQEWPNTAEIIIAVISLLLSGISVVLAVLVLISRDRKEIRAASPPFLILILLGSIFLFCSTFAFMPNLSKKQNKKKKRCNFSITHLISSSFFFSVSETTCHLKVC